MVNKDDNDDDGDEEDSSNAMVVGGNETKIKEDLWMMINFTQRFAWPFLNGFREPTATYLLLLFILSHCALGSNNLVFTLTLAKPAKT